MSETAGPAYRRVLVDLRDKILSGELAEGDRLPTMRMLAERHRVPIGSVSRAFEQLRAAGLIVTRGSAGTFVRTFRPIRRSSPKRLVRQRWGDGLAIQDADTEGRWRTVDVEIGEAVPPLWASEPLGLGEGESAAFRSRRFEVDGRSVQLATSWLPVDLARGTPIMHTDSGLGGIYARLADAGHAPVLFTEYLRVRMPLPDEVARLALLDGTPVFEIIRHAFEEPERCVEVNRMVLDGSAYLLDYTFPADELRPASGS